MFQALKEEEYLLNLNKVWNACGLRIGGLVTDNKIFNEKSIFEYTANLSANSIGQEIFGVWIKLIWKLKKWIYDQRILF